MMIVLPAYVRLIVFSLILISSTTFAQTEQPRNINSRDLSILISTEVNESPTPYIKLDWAKNELALNYTIRKKKLNDGSFSTTALAELDGEQLSYTDYNVQVGEIYEYEISAYSYGSILVTFKDNEGKNFDSSVAHYFRAYGYVASAIMAPEYDNPGKVLLLVDSTLLPYAETEIERLADDLVLDGWTFVRKDVARTEQFNGEAVINIKTIIKEEFAKEDDKLSSVILLGRIAVPYSGRLNPDAHGDHIGAWPSDVYYASLDEWNWSDFSVNDVSASREENRNRPGDGKFDQSNLGSGIAEIAIGRIDFYNMPEFVNDSMFTEIELYKKYLNKNHKYRTGQLEYELAGLIDDNFGAAKIWEGFGSSGWRNLAALTGKENVKSLDWFSTLKTESRLWAYGCGGGTYRSAGGIGQTSDFAANPVNTVFTMLFGSYFGDWDSQNNFLRAPLASDPSALTCAWAGRPHWYFHHMSLGFPIGYSTLISQNNGSLYIPNLFWLPLHYPQYPNGIIYTTGNRGVHVALMGDPTLRMHTGYVFPPTNLTVVQKGLNVVELDWEEPPIDMVFHSNVYRSFSKYGPFKRINTAPVNGGRFTDDISGDMDVFYMVRISIPYYSTTGSYYNQSRGLMKGITITSVESNDIEELNFLLSPNPASSYVDIQVDIRRFGRLFIEISDLNGKRMKQIYDQTLSAGTHQFVWNLSDQYGNKAAPGVYIIKIISGEKIYIGKIIVLP